jgi:hypothetical protein
MADIVSKKLAQVLNVDEVEDEKIEKNALTNQPLYETSLITDDDIQQLNELEESIGMESFSKIILMKIAKKAMNDHDELIDTMAKVDDSKAARLAEVAVGALNTASDAAKSLMNMENQKKKLALDEEKNEIEKQKLDVKVKSLTINNIGGTNNQTSEEVIAGTQKEIMEQIKQMMNQDVDDDDDETPPLIDN